MIKKQVRTSTNDQEVSKLKIGQFSFQVVTPQKLGKKEKLANTNVTVERDSKQALKETIKRQIEEITKPSTDENDPKVQSLMEKFKNGKKLTPAEMMYLRKKAPHMANYVERITREREAIELSMKAAPTKTDVQMVALHAAKQIEKYPNSEEREIRAKHLADAKHEYEKTDEYKEKPNSPIEMKEEPAKKRYKTKRKPQFERAIVAYEQVQLSFNVTSNQNKPLK